LENRLVPAVSVANAGTGLVIIAPDAADNIQVQASSKYVNVVGVNGTQVNFASNFNPAAFNGDINIFLGGGNDQVEIRNSLLPGRLTITEGNGNDTVLIHDLSANQIAVDEGNGNDTVLIHDLSANQIAVFGGAGHDTLQMFNASFGTTTVIGNAFGHVTAGQTEVSIHDVSGNVLNVQGGAAGNNFVKLRSAWFGALNLNGGSGNNNNLDIDASVSFGLETVSGF
jgi:hypothetical protein